MRAFAGTRSMAGCWEGRAEERAGGMYATGRGQDKSACHTSRKPLMRLGFCVAGGAVGCRAHGILQGIQGLCVAGACLAFPGYGQ
jgi:hypothetical protein